MGKRNIHKESHHKRVMVGRSRKLYLLLSWVVLIIILILMLSMRGFDDSFAKADDSSNGTLMDTSLFLAGSGDDPWLWIRPPDEDAVGESITVTVDEALGAGYEDVGTWNSSALDKDLHAQGQITFLFHINATENGGPDVRFRITMFGETFVSDDYYSTNTGISQVLVSFTVDGNVAFDEKISMRVEVDAKDSEPFTSEKEIHFHYWHEDYPSEVTFPSNATDISLEVVLDKDDQDIQFYDIHVNITDAFGEIHIDKKSFIINITSKNEPENYTAEHRNDGIEENKSKYIQLESAQYWHGFRYIAVKYIWYFEGVGKYANGREGQGVQPGDYWFRFEMKDIQGNDRYYHHLEKGVNPVHVHVNIHTDSNYITIVDDRNHYVPEVAQHDEVQVRVYIEMNKGLPDHTYPFYVELRDNGVLLEGGRKYVQMKGRTGLYLIFDWDPFQGTHTLSFQADSDNNINEVDESDNNGERDIDVIAEARPMVIISHPAYGKWINEGEKVLLDASNSTNPISGDMIFEWMISEWDGEDYILKEILDGEQVLTTKYYSPGKYKAEVEVSNDKRTESLESIFFINALPVLRLESPIEEHVYTVGEDIQFNANGSDDEDDDILYYHWTSDIDGFLNKDDSGTQANLSLSGFSSSLSGGVHHITLQLTDYDPFDPPENGKRGLKTETFTIIVNSPPKVEITTPLNGSSYSSLTPIEFDASGTRDPDGDDLTFTWYDWSRFMSAEVRFNETLILGEHSIILEVNDTKTAVVVEFIINVVSPPTANTVSIASAVMKDGRARVELDASGSTPSEDSIPIVKYIWDMDARKDSNEDGIHDNDGDRVETDPIVELEYIKTGRYTAILVVEDSAGFRSEPFNITILVLEWGEDEGDGKDGKDGENKKDEIHHTSLFIFLLLLLAFLFLELFLVIRMPDDSLSKIMQWKTPDEDGTIPPKKSDCKEMDNESFSPPNDNGD